MAAGAGVPGDAVRKRLPIPRVRAAAGVRGANCPPPLPVATMRVSRETAPPGPVSLAATTVWTGARSTLRGVKPGPSGVCAAPRGAMATVCGAGAGRSASGPRSRARSGTRPNTCQPRTIIAETTSAITISIAWTKPTTKKAIAACWSICPGTATSAASTGTAISSMIEPPSTANSGASAIIVSPLSQPVNSPRVPSNSAMTTKIGPTASSRASAMRAVTSRPTVPSNNSIAPIHIMPGGENAAISLVSPLACWTARKTTSSFCAKTAVALSPRVPVRMPAIWSGPPMKML